MMQIPTAIQQLLARPDWQDVEVLLLGASTLVIHLERVQLTSRYTRDIDVAVSVDSWQTYYDLTGDLTAVAGVPHRFVVDDQPVDIIPFGALESPRHRIRWPDDRLMNTSGIEDAMRTAEVLPGGVRIPTRAMLVALKVIAWSDRGLRQPKDAGDVMSLLEAHERDDSHHEIGAGLLELYDFDPVASSAHDLGLRIVEQASTETVSELRQTLDGEPAQLRFLSDSGAGRAGATRLEGLLAGLNT